MASIKNKQVASNLFVRTNKLTGVSMALRFPVGKIARDHVQISTAVIGRNCEKDFKHKEGRTMVLARMKQNMYITLPIRGFYGCDATEVAEHIFDSLSETIDEDLN